jgi:hypothetical protein
VTPLAALPQVPTLSPVFTLSFMLAVILSGTLLAGLLIVGMALRQRRRFEALRSAYPDAFVFGARSSSEFAARWSLATGDWSLRTVDTQVVVVDETGIGFFKGGARPRRIGFLPWGSVRDIQEGETPIGRLPDGPTIDIITDTGKEPVTIAFMVTRRKGGYLWPDPNPEATSSVCSALQTRLMRHANGHTAP